MCPNEENIIDISKPYQKLKLKEMSRKLLFISSIKTEAYVGANFYFLFNFLTHTDTQTHTHTHTHRHTHTRTHARTHARTHIMDVLSKWLFKT